MSKKGGGGAQTVTQESAPPAYLLPYLKQADAAASSLFNQGPPPLYAGQTYAPINATQQQALDKTLAYGNQPVNPATVTGVNTLVDAANSNPDPMQNPYIADMIRQQGLNANQIVAGNFNQGGRYGSGAHAAAAGTAVTNAQLPTLAAQYNTGVQNKLTSAALLPQMGVNEDQQQLGKAQAVGTVGDTYAAEAQKAINEAMSRFQYANGGGQQQLLQNFISNLSGLPNSGGSTTQTTSAPSQGLGGSIGNIVSGLGSLSGLSSGIGGGLGSFLGAGSSLAGAMGGASGTLGTIASMMSMFSDERLKTHIEYVGKENGHNVYEFEYKTGSGQRYRGVLAQEVLKKNPEAIEYDRSGYMKVNYGLIGVDFREIGGSAPICATAPASQGGLIEAGAAGCAEGAQQ